MSEELLAWVVAYLERDEEIVVPVKKLWNEWHTAHAEPALEAFTALVLADDRIEAMGEVDHDDGLEALSPADQAAQRQQMEAAGYFSGQRVKLKTRELTVEHVTRMITRHNERLEAALQAAYESMPPDLDEMEEGALLQVMELARELRRKLREAGLEAPEASDDSPAE